MRRKENQLCSWGMAKQLADTAQSAQQQMASGVLSTGDAWKIQKNGGFIRFWIPETYLELNLDFHWQIDLLIDIQHSDKKWGFSQLPRPVGLVAIQSCGWTPTILPAVLVVRWFPRLGAAERCWKSNPESWKFSGIPLELNFGVIGNRQKLGLWSVWSNWLVTMAGWTVFCISSRTFRCRLDFFREKIPLCFPMFVASAIHFCHNFLIANWIQLDFHTTNTRHDPIWRSWKTLTLWLLMCSHQRTSVGLCCFSTFFVGFSGNRWTHGMPLRQNCCKQWLQLRWLQLLCVEYIDLCHSLPRFERMQCIRTRSHAMFTCYPGTETQVIDASGQVSVELRQLWGGDPLAIQQKGKNWSCYQERSEISPYALTAFYFLTVF